MNDTVKDILLALFLCGVTVLAATGLAHLLTNGGF